MKKKFGDRKDAKRVRDISGLNQILIDLKPKRSLGEVYINRKIDVTNVVSYLDDYKKNHDEKLTLFYIFTAAVAKTMYHRNKLNRFVANRHLYEHNELVISFVAKIEFNDDSEEVMVLIPINDDDNLFTIANKIQEKVNSIRNKTAKSEGANDAILILGKLPNIIRVPIMGLFKYLDRIGHVPASLIKDNLYYSSMIISNIGSIKSDAIYHNLTDFGTCSGLIATGEIKEENGKYYCEFGATIDERVADGYYLVKSVHMIEQLLNDPKLLEERIDEKIKTT